MKNYRFPSSGAFLLISLLVLSPGFLFAGGYAILEQSVSGLGSAYAGAAAGAHGLTDLFFNPAVLARHPGRHGVMASTNLIMRSEFTFTSSTNVLGQQMSGTPGGDNIARPALIPALYATQDLPGPWRFALAVNSPWGLQSRNPSGWVGRYHALESGLQALNINPMIARNLNDRLSLGIGFQAQRVSAHLTNAIDFGTIARAAGVPGAVPGGQDGYGAMDGDDWGYGYTLGLLWTPTPKTRIGAGFRSVVQHQIQGNADFTYDSTGMARTLAAATGAFRSGAAKADMTTPDILSIGLDHELNQRWNITAEARRFGWSEFDELRVKYDNPAQADTVTDEKWKDVWSYALGFSYKASHRWTLRTGFCVEDSPVPDQTRTPRIPDSNRTWYSAGASYQARKNLRWDFGFSRLAFDSAPVRLTTADNGNTFRGNLTGEFSNTIDLIGVQVETLF